MEIKKNNYLLSSLVFLCLFFTILVLFKLGIFQSIDEKVNFFFINFHDSTLIGFFLVISYLFDPVSIILICFIFSFLLFMKDMKKESLFLLCSSMLGASITFVLKEIIKRGRPENIFESSFSFPSGHAVMTIVFFCSLIYIISKKVNQKYKFLAFGLLVFLFLIIIFGRFYLGVHWFSDILAGIFLGFSIFLLNLHFFKRQHNL